MAPPSDDVNARGWTDQLLNAMIRADRPAAARVIRQAIAEGMAADRVLADVLDPALAQIGRLWGRETVSLAQTFVAAKIAEDILLSCVPEGGAEAPHRQPAVIGNIEDDFHSLGRRIVGSFLRAAGWVVHDLGNDVPAEQFVDRAIEVGAAVVGVSAMMQTTALGIRKIRATIEARGLEGRLKLAVGGAVFNWRPDLIAEVGGDGTAVNASGADALFQRLQAEAKGGAQT
jgi:methanogenic corrinoid protein MtbC1